MESLASFLGLNAASGSPEEHSTLQDAADLSGPEFCRAVISSREYRQSIATRVTNGTLPPAVECRLLDMAWGKPVDRVEHTGKDGDPIVTEVRRVIVRTVRPGEDDDDALERAVTTH